MTSVKLFDTEYTTKDKIISLSKQLGEPDWLLERRLQAYQYYQELPFDKDTLFYKYTSFLRNFNPNELTPNWEQKDIETSITGLEEYSMIVDGERVISQLSEEALEKGVIFENLHTLIQKDEQLAKDLVDKASKYSLGFDKLGSLTQAFATHIIILFIPKNVILAEPISKITRVLDRNGASFCEIIKIFEEGSQVNFYDVYKGVSSGSPAPHLYSVMNTVYLGDNANVKTLFIQDLHEKALNLYSRVSNIDRYAKYRTLSQLQGGEMSRLNSNLDLIGTGAEGYDLFVSFGKDKQRFDIKSELQHIARDTIGQTHSRQVMMDSAESILRGLIIIPESGINADSWLTSAGMTLNKGRVSSVPALKIDQNDVKAAHAASVEPLNEELLFYLQTRGITEKDAREMLVKGYFEYVLRFLQDEKAVELARSFLNEKWSRTEVA